MQKHHWFDWAFKGIFVLFFGIMGYVTFLAYSRSSGSTGIDMSTVQQIRAYRVEKEMVQPL